MAATDTAKSPATTTAKDGPAFFRVRLSHPSLNRRTVFRSVSEARARAFIEGRYPRGSEAYLEAPTGETFHYEAERTGERGADAEAWQPFNPDDFVPVEFGSPPGQDEWADREG